MDDSGTDTEADGLLLRWREGRLDAFELFAAVRGAMYQGAQRGIRSITSSDPDPHHVEDAVYEAFEQLKKKDPADVSSVTGLAKMIALRRGQDIGRGVVREREGIKNLLADRVATAVVEFHDDDVRAAEEDERVVALAEGCFEFLTEEQRDLVVETIMGEELLSDWAFRNGKTHQAASRQRKRAIEAIRRCVESKRSGGITGWEGAQ
jgi:dihydroorotase-like cyclic amidohydrolase